MNTRVLLALLGGVLLGLTAGFLVANGFNRSEMNQLKAKADSANKIGSSNSNMPGDGFSISDDEIKAKIAEADQNPGNFSYQKNLGGALYRYATMKNDPELIDESKRILERANSLEPTDYDVLVDLGNAYFDLGYFKKEQSSFDKARATYEKAFAAKPSDADVRTDYAMTFYLNDPPDLDRAIEEFQKALKLNPKQERSLQFLSKTYIRQGNFAEAEKTVDQLKAVNPKNMAIADLESQITTRTASPDR